MVSIVKTAAEPDRTLWDGVGELRVKSVAAGAVPAPVRVAV